LVLALGPHDQAKDVRAFTECAWDCADLRSIESGGDLSAVAANSVLRQSSLGVSGVGSVCSNTQFEPAADGRDCSYVAPYMAFHGSVDRSCTERWAASRVGSTGLGRIGVSEYVVGTFDRLGYQAIKPLFWSCETVVRVTIRQPERRTKQI